MLASTLASMLASTLASTLASMLASKLASMLASMLASTLASTWPPRWPSCFVGFLKTQHRYEIVFTLPEVPGLGKDVCPAPVPSPHLRITDISSAPEGGLKVTCEYMAQHEGVLCEEVLLLSETVEDACVKVKVHARVMDRHHGTPMLLEGVRCIGVELEYDSEQSDWQGFD
ncbi:UPF0687 protein C20orf27-like protein [Larimichthys crocea]|uniref:UPF0687 protein C20orf27-like protein n=1 Tax=Larimichthys crocea TaxID=215358 RepID=A0A6G0HJH4_LARCR|nr:UPF0687 protein C20orf27-like protein [Larimichthys crocea]